ncbi:POLR3K [Symbiodinium sp. CCMP2592]|uniref:DNA-directed RNA polymerase subunit n=1 Tax=Symbiodinium necroappetens TaxID=1628268 RepID=A0A812VPR9_9DINO|nr:POLR3K [Symbiodinium sp. CCMP2592]CAE7636062.1 POLR3K [Symbiodinium necroappetens]CAE7652997.1 POLR3K [Symbiodinium sp. CCMP2456]|mmetsp:Transcript_133018/g.187954  ORF Transcript_133018/g.187954 Transcript_133018/m.187954 type:complete len:110 (-) Transcript_133018:64-393(-)
MAAQFCPTCANLLVIEIGRGSSAAFRCRTCPYVYKIREKLSNKQVVIRKEVDDVLGGSEAWKDVEQCDAHCPKCAHSRAYFRQMQTRSADEPMTTFYRCTQCGHNWKED